MTRRFEIDRPLSSGRKSLRRNVSFQHRVSSGDKRTWADQRSSAIPPVLQTVAKF